MNEYESEPVRGLPENLPEGEYIVWQGSPEWGALARRVFRVRGVALYFLLLLAWYFSVQLSRSAVPDAAMASLTWPLALGATALGILALLAWSYAYTTVYTLTNRRIVLRFGVAIPMMINLPLDRVESADLACYGDNLGDICLTLSAGERISYIALWPNARPWHFSPVKPALRGLHNPALVASLLADVVSATGTVAQQDADPDYAPAHLVSTRAVVT